MRLRFYLLLCILCVFVVGCASLHTEASLGNKQNVQHMISQGYNIEALAYEGTPLCYAARDNQVGMVKALLDFGANVNGGNPDGANSKSPLHQTATTGAYEAAKVLLEHGANTNLINRNGHTPIEHARANGNYQIAVLLENFKTSYDDWMRCQGIDTILCYSDFIKKYPESPYYEKANGMIEKKKNQQEKIEADRKKRISLLRQQEVCKTKELNWVFLGKSCSSGYAHGSGMASHIDGELKFEGEFLNGVRTNGVITHNDKPLFDGPIIDGRPDGVGVCFHEGSPEECKYYKGERIDILYKQRTELAAQRKYMEMLKEEMEQLKSQQYEGGAAGNVTTMGDHVKDALKKKATEKIADAIFDRLF